MIKQVLNEIQTKIGLTLKPYDNEIKTFKGVKYFDIELNKSIWMSKEYNELLRYSKKYKTFEIQQTGYKRVGIFLLNN